MTGRKGPSAELGPPHFMIARTTAIALLVLGLAGCGGGGAAKKPSGPRCPGMLPGASARVVEHAPQLLICSYAAGAQRLKITFDDGPSAWFRFDRAQVERVQTTIEWANTPNQQPKEVDHVGAGAFWVPATRELVASNGYRLLTVQVLRPSALKPARALAARIAPHGLGPNHVPVKTGP